MNSRTNILNSELERFVGILKDKYHPEKVIVFGSQASGKIHTWSDLDVAIIKKTNKPFIDRLKEVALLTSPDIGCDILVYTPEEFATMSKENLFVKEEIIKRGRVVYETN
ncbi:nucleotidyltransferase domain-containing protein [Candidatus Gottesmanbacteria bacterium]|nr:nucleotidyltransferase domain-containing protein [Candidatus Gottesmanbacteria bacterium]